MNKGRTSDLPYYLSYKVAQLGYTLWSIVDKTISELDYDDVVVYLLDYRDNTLLQCVAHGVKRTPSNQVVNRLVLPVGKRVVGTVEKIGRSIIAADTRLCRNYITDTSSAGNVYAVVRRKKKWKITKRMRLWIS